MKHESVELARQDDGKNKRDVQLTLHADGTIEINTCDSGEAPIQAFGREDYEWWVKLFPEEVPRLAFALLREKFCGNDDATDAAVEFCKMAGIAYKWSSYP